MNWIQKIIGHLNTINRHKLRVMALCFHCHLYKQGLLHDLSKYSFIELKTGFKYYQGFRSPINAQKEIEGYSMSWLHHKGRNPHHWEYWLDQNGEGIIPIEMEFNYLAEMFCDRIAASQIYQGDQYTDFSALDYYLASRDSLTLHPNTDQQILYFLAKTAYAGLPIALQSLKISLNHWRQTKTVLLPNDSEKIIDQALQRQKDLFL